MALQRVENANVNPELLGSPSQVNSAEQPTPPAEAPKVDQKITLDDAYLDGFRGGYVGVARIAVQDSMLPPEMQDLVSPNIVVSAAPVRD